MYIKPDWPAPPNVYAFMSTREEGNLAAHVGDDPERVQAKRVKLAHDLVLPSEPLWLDQQHTTVAVCADQSYPLPPTADASFSLEPGHVCAVLTADCLPILICDKAGTQVAAIHAGWRGLSAGVIGATIDQLNAKPSDLLVWLGVAMGPARYEVGDDVLEAFISRGTGLEAHFAPHGDKYLADLYAIAGYQLANRGVEAVYGGGDCTYSDPARFYSYRREGVTGRMATLIWMA